jgi:hypothetical protein
MPLRACTVAPTGREATRRAPRSDSVRTSNRLPLHDAAVPAPVAMAGGAPAAIAMAATVAMAIDSRKTADGCMDIRILTRARGRCCISPAGLHRRRPAGILI